MHTQSTQGGYFPHGGQPTYFHQPQHGPILAPFYNQTGQERLFAESVYNLTEKADMLANTVLGRKSDDVEKEDGRSERSYSSKGGALFKNNYVDCSDRRWFSVDNQRGGKNKDTVGIAIVGMVVTFVFAYLLGRNYKEYALNQAEIKGNEEEFGATIKSWNANTRFVDQNPQFKKISDLYNRLQAMLKEKSDAAWWNLALTVSAAASGFFVAGGAILAIDAMMIAGGLGILVSGTVFLIRLGYRSVGGTPESKLAEQVLKDSNWVKGEHTPYFLIQDNYGLRWVPNQQ